MALLCHGFASESTHLHSGSDLGHDLIGVRVERKSKGGSGTDVVVALGDVLEGEGPGGQPTGARDQVGRVVQVKTAEFCKDNARTTTLSID